MKQNLLTSMICAAAAVSSVSAFAYDTAVLVSGDRTTEMHMTLIDSSVVGGGSSTNLEIQQINTITNASTGPGAAALDLYTKASGGPETAYELTLARSWIPLYPPSGLELPNGSGEIPTEYNINTDVNGKIIGDSWSVSETVDPQTGDDIWTFTDFQSRSFVAFSICGSGDPVITDARATANSAGATVKAGCTLNAIGKVAYLTCDTTEECGQLSKSVPVPAFATAALALGLAGVTLITSRRRSIK